MWSLNPAPNNPELPWPAPVLARTVSSFTRPGARVGLLPCPATSTHSGNPGHCPTGGMDAALDTIHHLGRTARVLRFAPRATGPRPDQTSDHPVAEPLDPTPSTRSGPDPSLSADLIIARVCTPHARTLAAEQLAQTAAQRLRPGGILAVLSHTDHLAGRLVDPTGPIVTAGQNADLLYLQHIVILLTPIRGEQLHPPPHLAAGADENPAAPRASSVRPAAHRRIHADLTVLMQAHGHHPGDDPANPVQTSAVRAPRQPARTPAHRPPAPN